MNPTNNITVLQNEMDWLSAVIEQVLKSYFMQEGHEQNWLEIPCPDLNDSDSAYAQAIKCWDLNLYARLGLALAIAPHFRPEVLDVFFTKNQLYDRGFSEFGGVCISKHSGFLPTGQTLCFLLGCVHSALRTEAMEILSSNHILRKDDVLLVSETEPGAPILSATLALNNKWYQYFVSGKEIPDETNLLFTAQKISTPFDWNDVVLDENILDQVMEINSWMQYEDTLLNDWGLSKSIKPGYRALFYGPPGCGKTLTTTLLGKTAGRTVYKINTLLIVSKYFSETKKNISALFKKAQERNWILLFDEADALFGKRTEIPDAKDRFSNAQITYLRQCIEDYPGLVIASSTMKANMDEAFLRRFQSIIHFTIPGPKQRYQLWKNAFSGTLTLDSDIDLEAIANQYEVTGASVINIMRSCALAAIQRNEKLVRKQQLLQGIRNEFAKENKTIS
nr:ATP-binding protein [Chitinophagaceae bacterium]